MDFAAPYRYNGKSDHHAEVAVFKRLLISWLAALSLTSASPAQVEWTPGRYFPHFSAPDTVDVIPIFSPLQRQSGQSARNLTVDKSPDLMHALTLAAMQGIINRIRPSVFLIWTDSTANPPDVINSHWASVISSYVVTVPHDFTNVAAIEFLYDKYASSFKGAVIYDPKVPDTINLATMIAGLEDRMMLAPDQIGMEGIPQFADTRDLRELVAQEDWDDSFEDQLAIYQWAYDNLWPDLEHRIISFESPGPPSSSDKETPDFFFRPSIGTRDYVVALKLPALYLNPKYPDHRDLMEKYLADAPSPIVIFGSTAFNEDGVVRVGSAHGDVQIAAAWPGESTSTGNLTVLGGIRPEIKKAHPSIDEDNIFAGLAATHVATLFTSDGDAVFYQMARGFLTLIHWENVQGQNFAWETEPLLTELAPPVWNYYQETNEGVSFTSGISGGGYVSPPFMDQDQLAAYLDRAAVYLEESGLHVVRFNGIDGPWDSTYAAAYYDHLKDSGFLGTIIGFRESSRYGTNLEYLGRPAPAVKPIFDINGQNVDEIVETVLASDPGRIVMKFMAPGNVPEITQVDDDSASGGSAMLISTGYLNAQSCCLSFDSGAMTLLPGDYRITTRLKVADNTSPNPVAYAYVGAGFEDPEPLTLGLLQIKGTDFEEAERYQT
ncbi:MAG: hypothetical protein WBW88_03985, partial [Rhodothermales bacterium]